MILTIKMPGFWDPVPEAPAVFGYGCSVQGFELLCPELAVHHVHPPGPLAAKLIEEGKSLDIQVNWPEDMPKGTYRDIRLKVKL